MNLALLTSEAVKAHHGTPTIREIHPDELTTPLQTLILQVAQKQGIVVDKLGVQDISAFTCRHFKDFTLPEILLAFEYYNAGKLQLPENFGSYGLLSQNFWGGVLKAMRVLRHKESQAEQLNSIGAIPSQTDVISEVELAEKNRQAMAQGVLEVWEMMKNNEVADRYTPIIMGIGHLYYDFLRDNGIMQKPEPEQEQKIRNEAAKFMQNEIRLRQQNAKRTELKTLAAALNDVRKNPNFKNTCKKLAVRAYLADLVLAEVDLQELIIKTTT